MSNRTVRTILTMLGILAGLAWVLNDLAPLREIVDLDELAVLEGTGGIVLVAALGGLIGFALAPLAIQQGINFARWLERKLQATPLSDILAGAIGLTFGLILTVLIAPAVTPIPMVGDILPLVTGILLGYMGWTVGVKKKDDFISLFDSFRPSAAERASQDEETEDGSRAGERARPKILDTSVIIDGRILDVCRAGFIEGRLIVADFVLDELRHVADSSDALKRNRGRRGLDVLKELRKDLHYTVEIYEGDIASGSEVDVRLVQLAREFDGTVLTNDFNLNKVAELHDVEVLNINELANALKPVVLPGEEMSVQLIRDGTEPGQGVGYLDDGTMIVVDDGKEYVGEEISVTVTSVLQTSAGRMIFARPRQMRKAAP